MDPLLDEGKRERNRGRAFSDFYFRQNLMPVNNIQGLKSAIITTTSVPNFTGIKWEVEIICFFTNVLGDTPRPWCVNSIWVWTFLRSLIIEGFYTQCWKKILLLSSSFAGSHKTFISKRSRVTGWAGSKHFVHQVTCATEWTWIRSYCKPELTSRTVLTFKNWRTFSPNLGKASS